MQIQRIVHYAQIYERTVDTDTRFLIQDSLKN